MINFNINSENRLLRGRTVYLYLIKYKKILLYTSINNIRKYPPIYLCTLASISRFKSSFCAAIFYGAYTDTDTTDRISEIDECKLSKLMGRGESEVGRQRAVLFGLLRATLSAFSMQLISRVACRVPMIAYEFASRRLKHAAPFKLLHHAEH